MTRRVALLGSLAIAAVLSGCGRGRDSGKAPQHPPTRPPAVPGVDFQEVTVSKFAERPRLWIYRPKDRSRNHPCIVIAAAGSNLASGMDLSEGDRPEHLPYVNAGYIVVAYDVSGALREGESQAEAMRLFARRNAGVDNGKAAIDYALRSLPIDPMRLYAVGHSSAGTLALELAAADSRIRGCVAFAPVTDVRSHLHRVWSQINRIPELERAIQSNNPANNLNRLRCPLMLFTALDDTTVPSSDVVDYFTEISHTNEDAKIVRAQSGGHYDSMISEGIPAAIQWLNRARRAKAPTSK